MDFKKILENSENDILRRDPSLKNRILFSNVTGNYAYGTNVITSDLG